MFNKGLFIFIQKTMRSNVMCVTAVYKTYIKKRMENEVRTAVVYMPYKSTNYIPWTLTIG